MSVGVGRGLGGLVVHSIRLVPSGHHVTGPQEPKKPRPEEGKG